MGEEKLVSEYTTRSRLTNQQSRDVSFMAEPWGGEFSLPSGSTVDLVAQGPADGVLEWEIGEDVIVVYGWVGSTVQVYLDGKRIEVYDHPVPQVPQGMSVSGFANLVFREPEKPGSD
jgi:hypothetical protein